jgi:ubiquinol-cytochrome c reductase cytochrome c1 subunit
MKKLILAFLLAVVPAVTMASGDGVHLDVADIDVTDIASLQRGAKFFMNYCTGCHSLKYQRYNRLARDLGLTADEVKANLMFTTDNIGEPITISMDPQDAKKWFGVTPPDLSVTARSRGVDWIYTYLRSFYTDESRPFGVNNTVFPDVGMPNVLWQLQGTQKAVVKEVDGEEVHELELVKPGTLSAEEFDGTVRDLTAFLSYVGEPIQAKRRAMGKWVLLFIGLFFILAYMLKKEYWKDIH